MNINNNPNTLKYEEDKFEIENAEDVDEGDFQKLNLNYLRETMVLFFNKIIILFDNLLFLF